MPLCSKSLARRHEVFRRFTKLWPAVFAPATGLLSFYLLSISLKFIPFGTAYVVWTGIGAVGGVIVGMLLFHESRDVLRLVSIALVIAGIVGLKVSGT